MNFVFVHDLIRNSSHLFRYSGYQFKNQIMFRAWFVFISIVLFSQPNIEHRFKNLSKIDKPNNTEFIEDDSRTQEIKLRQRDRKTARER